MKTSLAKVAVAMLMLILCMTNVRATTLTAGDLALIGINTDNPDSVGVVVLVDLTAGTTFNITDNGWLAAGGFRSGEGVLTYTVPTGGITKGTVLIWTNSMTIPGSGLDSGWSSAAPSSFSLNSSGESVIIYTGTLASPTLIYAAQTKDAWDTDATSASTSAEPTAANNGTLVSGTTTFDDSKSDGYYAGTTTGSKSQILSDLQTWTTANSYQPLSSWKSKTSAAGVFTITTAPTVTSSAATSIGTTTATLNGNVTSDGGSALTDYGFYWSTTSPVTTSSTKAQVGTSDISGAYTKGLTGLSVNTIYYYRAYANNSAGNTLDSADVSFYTLANTPTAPTVNGPTASSLNVAIGGSDGNPAATTYAIKETTTGNFVQSGGALGASPVFQTASAWGTKTVTGLSPSTTYTFEAEAQNGAGTTTSFGSTANGTTSAAVSPTISVTGGPLNFSPVAVNGTSANMTYTVSGANLTHDISINAPANFQISTSSGSGFGSSLTLTQSGGTVNNTTIYVQFNPTAQQSYSGNIANTSTGATEQDVAVSGTGAVAPSVSSSAATSIGTAVATLNGNVTSDGGATITDRGFVYKTSSGVTISDNKTTVSGTTGSFTLTPILGVNVQYYFKAYAINSIGTTLSTPELNFWTLAATPTAPTVSGATTSSLNVTIGTGNGNPSTTQYAIQETGSGNYVQSSDGSRSATADWQTATTWSGKTVTGLSLGTSYTFQVKARSGANTETAFGPATTAYTANNPFTPGHLVVYRVGDGTAALSSAGTAVFLDEYNTSGTLIQSFPLPTTSGGSANALVSSGTSTSEGLMTRSTDGRYLTLAGYKAAVGTSGVGSSASATTPRTIARVDGSANIDTSTALTDASTGNNMRSVASVDGTGFWVGGGAGDARYAALGATTSTDLESAIANVRQINIFNGQLYVTTSSGTTYRLATIGTGIPTTTGQTAANLPGFPSSGGSPYAFYFCTLNGGSGPDTVYVADDGSTTGIQNIP